MLLFGKPGAGKGTLTARLMRKYDIVPLSTGDMLRQHIVRRTEIGRRAEAVVSQGGLLPDDVMLGIVAAELEAAQNKHWVLDGFPRTLRQGEMLDEQLKKINKPLRLIVNLDVPDELTLKWICERWIHLPSGRIYGGFHNRPKMPGIDDATGEPLSKRADDNPETFMKRLAQFYLSSSPLLAYYESICKVNKNIRLVTLKGNDTEEIWPMLDRLVQETYPSIPRKPRTRDQTRIQDQALRPPLAISESPSVANA